MRWWPWWGARRGANRYVLGPYQPSWLALVAPPDAAPLPPGSEPDVVIVPHTADGAPPPVARTGPPSRCDRSVLGPPGARPASGLLAVFREGERDPLDDGPAASPAAGGGRTGPGRADPDEQLERTVVALGRRTEALAAHLARIESRLERLGDVPARARRTGT